MYLYIQCIIIHNNYRASEDADVLIRNYNVSTQCAFFSLTKSNQTFLCDSESQNIEKIKRLIRNLLAKRNPSLAM
jgi:hypothetical protein